MKAKRILSILLVLVLCITAFTGCGSEKDTKEDADTTSTTDDFFEFDSSETDGTDTSDTQSGGNDTPSDSNTSNNSSTQQPSNQEGGIVQNTVKEFTWPKLKFKSKKVTVLSPYDYTEHYGPILKKQYGLELEYISVTWHEMSTKLAALTMSGQSPDLIFYRQDNPDYPSYIYKGFVRPIDDLMDWNNEIYKDLLWHYGKTKVAGKNYLLISSFSNGPLTLYNKKAFKDAGVTDPWTLYKQGKWNWNTLLEIAPQLCVDTNGDGANDQKALSIGEPYSLMYTTGQTYGAIDDANKTCKNNIKNRNIARAMNFMYDLIFTKGYAMQGVSAGDQQFADEYTAMNFVPVATDALSADFERLRKRGDLGIAPMPQDPNANKLYYYTRMTAMFIGKNAKNPEGAIAYNAVTRYFELDKTKVNDFRTSLKKDYKFDNEMIAAYYESVKSGTPVVELTPFIGYTTTWNCLQEGTPWASQVAKDEKSIQASINDVFAKE